METLARLRLESDSTGLVKGADQGTESLGRLAKQAGAAEGATTRLTGAYAKAAQQLTRIAAFAGLTFGVQALIRYADSWKSLEGQLKLVTKSSSELLMVQDRLFKMAQSTRQTYESTVSVYTRMARSAGDLGLSTEKMIRVTELINKTLIISGTSAAGASGALMQLGQALGQGALRGDELISVMEGMPELAMQVAEGMGIPWAKFRQNAAEGKITSQNIIQGLLKQADEIDEKFSKVPERVSDGMTKVSNSFLKLVGEADKGLGATSVLSKGLTAVADNLEKLATAALQVGLFMGARWLSGPLRSLETFVVSTVKATGAARLESQAILEDTMRTKEKTIADQQAAFAAREKLELTRANIIAARAEAAAVAASAAAQNAKSAAVPIASLAPLGGAAVAREMEKRAVATATAAAAERQLIQTTLALESVDYKLEVANGKVIASTLAVAEASTVAGTTMAGMTFAARAGATAMGFLGKAMEFLKANWIILAITVIVEGLLWWSRRGEEARRKVQELADAQKEQIKVMKEATDVMLEQGRALIDNTKKYNDLVIAAGKGKAALDEEKRKQAVIEKGGQVWDAYVKKNQAAEGAQLKFSDAVAKGIPLALALQKEAGKEYDARERSTKAEERLTKAIDASKEARQNSREQINANAEAVGRMVVALDLELQRRTAILGGEVALERFNEQQDRANFITGQAAGVIGSAKKAAEAYAAKLWDAKRANEALAALKPAASVRGFVSGDPSISTSYKVETQLLKAETEAAERGTAALRELGRVKEVNALQSALMAEAAKKGVNLTADAAWTQAEALQAERAEIAKTSDARMAAIERSKQLMENLMRGVQTSFTTFFNDIFQNGLKSFQDLFASIKRLFFNLVAEMASAKLTQKMASAIGVGVGANGQFDFTKMKGGSAFGKTIGGGGSAISVGQALGAAGAGAGIGYGIGYASGNRTTGVLGGAAGGAAAGALIGGPVGAVVGGVLGAAAGWLGASKKAKEAAKAMEEARKTFEPALDAFRRLATGTLNELADSLRSNNEQRDALLKQANDAYKGTKNELVRNQKRGEIYSLAAQNARRLKQEFIDGVTKELNDARGLGASNSIQDIFKKRNANAAGLTTAGGDPSKAFELAQAQFNQLALSLTDDQFKKALDGLPDNLKSAAQEMWNLAEASRNAGDLLTEEGKKTLVDIELREKLLAGRNREVQVLAFLRQEEDALAAARKEGVSDTGLARLSKVMREEFVQSMMEAEKSVLQNIAVTNLRTKGLDDQADAVELVWRQEAELAAYRKQGLDDSTLAAIEAMQAEQRLAAERARTSKITATQADFASSYYQKVANNSGSPDAQKKALTAQLTESNRKELEAARKLVDQGYITEEHYKRLAAVLNDDLNKALENLELQVLHAAKSFTEDQELRRLAVLERVGGQDASAQRRKIEKDRELREAALSGKSPQQVRQIQYSQEIEDLATTFEKETEKLAQAITDDANKQLTVLNEQLETAKNQLQAQEQAAQEFARQAQEARAQAETLRSFARTLKGTGASPEKTLSLAEEAYRKALGSGDAGQIQTAGSAYVEAARSFFGSGSEFQKILEKVTKDVDSRASAFEGMADGLQAQAAAMTTAAQASLKLVNELEAQRQALSDRTQKLLDDLAASRKEEFVQRLKELEEQQKLREALAAKLDKPTDGIELPPFPPIPPIEIPPIEIPPITFPSLARDLEPVTEGLDKVATITAASGVTITTAVNEVRDGLENMQSQMNLLAEAIRGSQPSSRLT